MAARGVDFLEGWIATNIKSAPKDPADAGVLTAKLLAEATVAGFTLADMDLDEEMSKTTFAISLSKSASRVRRGIEVRAKQAVAHLLGSDHSNPFGKVKMAGFITA